MCFPVECLVMNVLLCCLCVLLMLCRQHVCIMLLMSVSAVLSNDEINDEIISSQLPE